MRHQTSRIVLDLLLSVMLVFEMFYSLTGNVLHELVGLLFFVTLVIHIVLSRKWFKGVSAKSRSGRKLTAKQRGKLIMSVALGIVCVVLLASSVLISNVLSTLTGWRLGLDAFSWWAYAHTLCAYAVCAFAICHVGLHWVGVFNALKIPYSVERRNAINVGVMSVAALGVVALGSAATKALAVLPAEALGHHGNGPAESASSGTPNEDGPGNGLGNGRSGEQGDSVSNDAKGNGSHGLQRGQRNGKGNGYGNGKGSGYDSGSDGGSLADSGSSSGSSTRPEDSSPNADLGNGSSSSGSGSGSGSFGSTSGTCTLCHEHCPLSAPRCSKPYAAGLI